MNKFWVSALVTSWMVAGVSALQPHAVQMVPLRALPTNRGRQLTGWSKEQGEQIARLARAQRVRKINRRSEKLAPQQVTGMPKGKQEMTAAGSYAFDDLFDELNGPKAVDGCNNAQNHPGKKKSNAIPVVSEPIQIKVADHRQNRQNCHNQHTEQHPASVVVVGTPGKPLGRQPVALPQTSRIGCNTDNFALPRHGQNGVPMRSISPMSHSSSSGTIGTDSDDDASEDVKKSKRIAIPYANNVQLRAKQNDAKQKAANQNPGSSTTVDEAVDSDPDFDDVFGHFSIDSN